MNPFLAGSLFTLSILSLQLGLSYWSSGATLSCLFYLLLVSVHRINPLIYVRSLFPLWLCTSILIFQISYYENLTLVKLRLIFFLILTTIIFSTSARLSLSNKKIFWISQVYDAIGILLPHSLLLFYLASLVPSSPFNPEKLAVFKDKWLIANKTWETIDQALNSLLYGSQVSRISLLYGEPSYLAMAVFVGLFIVVTAITINPIKKLIIKPTSLLSRDFLLISSFFSGILLLITSFSAYGIVCLLFILAIAFSRTNLLQKVGLASFYILALILVFSIFFVNSDFLAPLATRFLYIVNGQDESAGGRIYALTFLPESLFRVFGLGDQLQNTLNNSNYQAVDVGLAAFSLTYGFPFLFYTASIYFRLKKTVPHFALVYFLYILLIWSQSGNILSTDKFFATILPFPLILISARLLEFNSLKSAPIRTNYAQNLSS